MEGRARCGAEQMPLIPNVTLESWKTDLGREPEQKIAVRQHHATSEQPSGEFEPAPLALKQLFRRTLTTNALVIPLVPLHTTSPELSAKMGLFGQRTPFRPLPHAKRRSILQIIQELIYHGPIDQHRPQAYPALQPPLSAICRPSGCIRATRACAVTATGCVQPNQRQEKHARCRNFTEIWMLEVMNSRNCRFLSDITQHGIRHHE